MGYSPLMLCETYMQMRDNVTALSTAMGFKYTEVIHDSYNGGEHKTPLWWEVFNIPLEVVKYQSQVEHEKLGLYIVILTATIKKLSKEI